MHIQINNSIIQKLIAIQNLKLSKK
jgi:hypothetical protein